MTTATLIAILTAASSWTTTCTQTQADGKQGSVIDRAVFTAADTTLQVEFTREWHKDATCSDEAFASDSNMGLVTIGKEIQNPFGNSSETVYEADFALKNSTELGALSVSKDEKTLRVARGFGKMRNTMLSLMGYTARK